MRFGGSNPGLSVSMQAEVPELLSAFFLSSGREGGGGERRGKRGRLSSFFVDELADELPGEVHFPYLLTSWNWLRLAG